MWLQVVKLKQVEHTLSEKHILQAITLPFVVRLDYSFKVSCKRYMHPMMRVQEGKG